MTATPQPSKLAPFQHDSPAWIGGDISLLSQFAGVLYECAPKIDNVAGLLDEQVNRMVSAAHWQGDAASTFSSSWEKDSITARKIASMAVGIGQIVDELALQLSKIEAGLEQIAPYYRARGVKIGPDGQPPPYTSTYTIDETGYANEYNGSVAAANNAREYAVSQLTRYNGVSHTPFIIGGGLLGAAGAEAGLTAFVGGLPGLGETMLGGARVGSSAAELLSSVLPIGDSAIAAAADTALIGTASVVGFFAVPVAVGIVGYGVGAFASSFIAAIGDGKSPGQSLDVAAHTVAEPALAIGHEAEHLWDSIF